MPLYVEMADSSSGGASTMGSPNWTISLPWPFIGLFETINACAACQNISNH